MVATGGLIAGPDTPLAHATGSGSESIQSARSFQPHAGRFFLICTCTESSPSTVSSPQLAPPPCRPSVHVVRLRPATRLSSSLHLPRQIDFAAKSPPPATQNRAFTEPANALTTRSGGPFGPAPVWPTLSLPAPSQAVARRDSDCPSRGGVFTPRAGGQETRMEPASRQATATNW
ncbi:unnamed protein product [Protopolystoma xenopodis]|uniref:Uncharacterized protein n=1 Tax=Protopolystoma xenopodis TaxID=117903 RepID=A0A448X6R5_9PLAT|nr:unnamed protein product [Protopolystoma xenopodis]